MSHATNSAAKATILREFRLAPVAATALAAALKISPRSTLRLFAELGDNIVSSGHAQRRRCAARRPLRGMFTALPVFALDQTGKVS